MLIDVKFKSLWELSCRLDQKGMLVVSPTREGP